MRLRRACKANDRGPRARGGLAAVVLLAALPLAPTLAAVQPYDPLERLNRATFAFNDALDRMLARPAARAYKTVVPDPARQAVSNFFGNLSYPKVIVNDALQGKVRDAGADTVRFVVNTVLGIGGFADPATRMGLANHDEDFGQTLGYWGVPAGPYLVLPVFGPSDSRDAPAKLVVDRLLSPAHYVSSRDVEYGLFAFDRLDLRAQLLATDAALQEAFDPYTFVRNAYVTRREYLVRDGNVPEETYDEPIGAIVPTAPGATARAGRAGRAANQRPSTGAWAVGRRRR